MTNDPLRFHHTLKAAYRRAVKAGKADAFIAAWRAVYTAQTADELRQALAQARTFALVEDRVIRDFEALDPDTHFQHLMTWEKTK